MNWQKLSHSVWINGIVLVPKGFPKALHAIQQLGV